MNETDSLPEPEEEPFRLAYQALPAKRKYAKRKQVLLNAADLKILAMYIHREDFTRAQLAAKFRLSLKQLQRIIREQGWQSNGDDYSEDTCTPLPNPNPADFVACPYKAGTDAKIWMLAERFARRLPLWHPRDNPSKVKQRREDSL